MCIEEEIEVLDAELADIKGGKIDSVAYDRLEILVENCKKAIRSLSKEITGASRLRNDYFANCKAQIHSIQQKAKHLIKMYYQYQTAMFEF